MVSRLLIAWGLVALCVVVHASRSDSWADAAGWRRRRVPGRTGWPWLRLSVSLAGWIVLPSPGRDPRLGDLLRLAWRHARSQTALYFSAVTYTTTGYGDLVLPQGWRLVGGVEALTGILMCGWSAGFFVLVSRIYKATDVKP